MDNTIEMLQSEIQRLKQENNELREDLHCLKISNHTLQDAVDYQGEYIEYLVKLIKQNCNNSVIASIDPQGGQTSFHKHAYETVFNELLEIGYLRGEYDAKNANEYFVMGAQSVMEEIAARASDDLQVIYLAMIAKTRANSIKKVGKQNDI